ncbi:histidine kinase dimerization/phospho-acceptor domain-containing protein [uncultured Erythrobacter sp.]|uniref:histidine kinase dimerization/phospho-acceptor domain-containing protein n=1 Tax=uncultured Erythrobacter sp. TaxID=263913 RepID=UPI0026090CB6|nr:histidine kinase dimerization/phospho-acceptor domain-containing protein [uncultured Erythrobacter sp.]
MFFDDRLATVLRQSAQSDAMRRTQFRQLLDLLGAQASGARKPGRDPSLVAAAWMRMSKLAEDVPSKDRAQLISEPSWHLRNPELVAHLAEFEPEVASAALSRAKLSSDDWTALIPRLPVRARGFLRLRRDMPDGVEATLEQLGIHDRGLPQPQSAGADADGDQPLDLNSAEELPAPGIPPEDIPREPPTTLPIEQNPEEVSDAGDSSTPLRPIFFPKNRSIAHGSEENTEDKDYKPQPFTIEELRQISDKPLGDNEDLSEDAKAQSPDDRQTDGRSEISALVERIAKFQRNRESTLTPEEAPCDSPPDGDPLMPRLPLGEEDSARVRAVRGFGFVADAAGRIEWAEEGAASMVIGTRLLASSRLQSGDFHEAVTTAFNRRQPIRAAPFTLAGAPAIAGNWVVDAQPRFSQIGGFAGYVGRMRRPIEAVPSGPTPAQAEADRIRQLLHELRTPVTAVQGYSEVIQQQLFGSAPHEYRALAAAIAADAARILSGFEELDRLAKLETGAIEIDEGQTDIAAVTHRIVKQFSRVLEARMAGVELEWDEEAAFVAAIDADNAESLMWRLLASLGGGCAAGEMLQARLGTKGGSISLTLDLPMQLLGEDDLFAADARPLGNTINPGLFGAGFALRLARAEARSGGGDLVRNGDAICLTLPKANASQAVIRSETAEH